MAALLEESQPLAYPAQPNTPEETKINLRLKLASLWASFMFLYIYVDYLHLYMPGSLRQMMSGQVYLFEITQIFLLAALASVTPPALMIFFSIYLPSNVNRWTNTIISTIYIPYTLFNLAGEAWAHMVFAAVAEVAILLLIILYSQKWPRIEARNTYERKLSTQEQNSRPANIHN